MRLLAAVVVNPTGKDSGGDVAMEKNLVLISKAYISVR